MTDCLHNSSTKWEEIWIDLTPVFFLSTFDLDKLGEIRWHHWKEPLKIKDIAKFESDLVKSNKDMAPQLNLKSRNLRHFCMVGGTNLAPTRTNVLLNFCNFAELYLRSLTTHHFQIWQFNFKALFPVVLTDFPKLVHVKSWKSRGRVYQNVFRGSKWLSCLIKSRRFLSCFKLGLLLRPIKTPGSIHYRVFVWAGYKLVTSSKDAICRIPYS